MAENNIVNSGDEDVSVHVGEPDSKGRAVSPWSWVPSVYFLQGLQYAIVIQLFAIVFFTMGIPQGDTLFWVGLLSLPWTIKPLWGPLVDKYWTKRSWTFAMQFLVGLGFALVGFSLLVPGKDALIPNFLEHPPFFYAAVVFLLIAAFGAATHDIACDGYYMLGLSEKKQAFYVGVRSTFFRIALMVANGALLVVADIVLGMTGLETRTMDVISAPAERVEVVEEPNTEEVVASDTATEQAEVVEVVEYLQPQGTGQEILFSTNELTIPADGEATFHVRLTEAPTDGERVVTLRLGGGGFLDIIGLGPARFISLPKDKSRLVFTDENWERGEEVRITADENTPDDLTAIIRARSGNIAMSWTVVSVVCALMFLMLSIYHKFVLPYPESDTATPASERPPFIFPVIILALTLGVPWLIFYGIYWGLGYLGPTLSAATIGESPSELAEKGFSFFFAAGRLILLCVIAAVIMYIPSLWKIARGFFSKMSDASQIGFFDVFSTFFTKEGMGVTLAFLLTFRLGEAQLAQVKNLFLLDTPELGGLNMSLGQLAFVNTAIYLVALTIGGILGGVLIARYGLKSVIWWMVAFMHLPNALYIYLAWAQPDSLLPVNIIVGFESFGYGFGFTAYLMIMILAAQGPYRTAHYALCTGAMALGYMIPGMWSGYLQELVGYPLFFILVMIFVLPGTILIPFLKIDPTFGMKSKRT